MKSLYKSALGGPVKKHLENRKARDQKGYFVGLSLHDAGQLQKTTRRGTAEKGEKRRG